MPDLEKPIYTVKSKAETTYKEKGSVFNGIIYPVSGEEEINIILTDLRKKFYDATHHCYAFRLNDGRFRYSDDGEPSGTAGIRILNAIDHFQITEVVCVVVRWFGGTKLGVGPLGKAYYKSAEQTIEVAEIVKKLTFYSYIFTFPYEFTSQVYHILDKYKVKILTRDYSSVPKLNCLIPVSKEKELIAELKQSSNNKIEIQGSKEIISLAE